MLGATVVAPLTWSPVSAQSVTGEVRTSEGEPLIGVQVVARPSGQGAVTDAEGVYLIERLPEGPSTLVFRFVGFRTVERELHIPSSGQLRVDVVLEVQAVQVDEVVVTAEAQAAAMLRRSTRSVTVLDTQELDELRGQTLGQMLSELPGVTTLTTGPSISKPVVRGLHSQRLVVLNAGVAQEGQQWGGEHAPEIDPFAPARVEVIKGAAGVEYGVGAIGGVIRLEPAELPVSTPLRGSLSTNGFSNNRQGAGSVMIEGGPLRYPGLGWRVQSSYRRAGDSRTPDYVIGNSGFRELDGSVTLGYEGDRLGWHAYVSHFGTTLGLFRGAHIGNYDDLLRAIERGEPAVEYDFGFGIDPPKQKIAHDLATLRGHVRLPSGDWLEAQYGLQSNRRKEFDAHGRFDEVSEDPAFSLTLETHSLDLKLRQRPRGKLLAVLGLSGTTQANRNGQSGMLIPNFRASTGGAFARGSWVSGDVTLEAGLRFDYRRLQAWPRENLTRGDFVRRRHSWSSPSGVLGVVWRFSDHWSVASNLATAWRPPGVNELYNFGVHHGTAQFEVGDPGLGSERSLGLDLTLRHLSESFTVEVSGYVNRMEGYIYLRPEAEPRVTIRGTFPSFRYAQTDARLAGIDGSVSVQLREGTSASGVLSLVRGQDLSADEPLIFMPADRIRLALTQRIGAHSEVGVSSTLVARQDRVPQGLDFADPPDGYALVGLEGSTIVQAGTIPIDVSFTVDNLLNRAYRDYLSRFRYFIDDPGRTVALRIRVPVGGS